MQELDGALDFTAYVGEIKEKLTTEETTVIENMKYGEKTKQLPYLLVKMLTIVLLCCVGVVMLASCGRGSNEFGLLVGEPIDYGGFLASIDMKVGERHYVYEIYENIVLGLGDINVPIPPEFYYSSSKRGSGMMLSRTESRNIKRLLNELLENERGSLGLIDYATHITIRQGEVEIHFTRGMADIPESDELISKIHELFCIYKHMHWILGAIGAEYYDDIFCFICYFDMR